MRSSDRANDVMWLSFSDASSRRGPTTWAQRAIWLVLRWEGDGAHRRNLTNAWDLPEGIGTASVLDTFREVIVCCEALRTTYHETSEREPIQVVHDSGAIEVHLRRARVDDIDTITRGVTDQLRERRFDLTADLPIRIAVISVDDRPVRAVIVLSHLTADGWGVQIMRRLFLDVLRKGRSSAELADARTAEQPIDRARYESGPAGVRAQRLALEFWTRAFREIPRSMFEGQDERYTRAEGAVMHSHPMAAAVRRICARDHVTSSAVVIAAAAKVVSSVFGESDIAIRVLVGTRFHSRARHSIAALNLNGLFRTTTLGELDSTYFRRAMQDYLRAALYSQCDPVTQNPTLEAVMRGRGVSERQFLFYNDKRYSNHDIDRPEGTAACSSVLVRDEYAFLADVTRACDGSTWIRRYPDARPDKESKFLLTVHDISGAAEVSVHLDRRFFPDTDAEQFLGLLEQVLTDAAGRSVTGVAA